MTPDKESSAAQASPRPLITLPTILTVLGVAVLLFGTYHVLLSFLHSTVRDQMEDPRFLQRLSRVIRPSVVFDEKDRVLGDFGAMSLLEGIVVTPSQADQTLIIVVKPREFLGVEPI